MMTLLLCCLAFLQESPESLRGRYGNTFDHLPEAERLKISAFQELAFKYLAAPDSGKEALRDQLKSGPMPPLSAVKTILRRGGPCRWPEMKPGATVQRRIKLEGREGEIEYSVIVPNVIDKVPNGEDGSHGRLPILFGLIESRELKDQPVFQAILPSSMWYEESWGAGLLGIRTMAAAIRDAVDGLPVDPDRVFLHGGSAIGYGSWQTALHHSDLIAGLHTDASMPIAILLNKGTAREKACLPPLANLLEVSNHWQVAPADTAHFPKYMLTPVLERFRALKFRDLQICMQEEGAKPCPECDDLYRWLKARPRVAWPAEVTLETDEKILKRNRWIEILRFKNRETYQLPIKVGGDTKVVEERTKFVDLARVKGTIDKAANTVTLTNEGADQIRIYLSDELLDLTKEVKVIVDGNVRSQKKPELNGMKILDAARATGNRTLPYDSWVDVTVK